LPALSEIKIVPEIEKSDKYKSLKHTDDVVIYKRGDHLLIIKKNYPMISRGKTNFFTSIIAAGKRKLP
jgi:hypothetical protein